jgi:ABC-2 type transport system ATP-binding protein
MKLVVENISVCTQKIHIIHEISFELSEGSVLGLIGPNGSGKSTLMKALIGVLSKTGRSNLLDMNQNYPKDDSRLTFGFVPEEPILYDYMSVYRNFMVTSISKGLKDSLHEIESLIQLLRLYNLASRKIRSLSQGEKKRVSIGLALLGNPDVLLLDEPHNGLDVDGIMILKSIIETRAKDHIIVLCSHYFSEIEAHCTHILALDKGEIMLIDSMETIMGQYRSIEQFFTYMILNPTHEKNLTV